MHGPRIELDRVPQARDRLVPMSKPSLDQGDRLDDISAIRKTLLGSLEFRQCPAEIALPVKAVIPKSKMSFRQIWIKCERAIECILGGRQPRQARVEPHPIMHTLGTGEICPGQRETGIQLHCL